MERALSCETKKGAGAAGSGPLEVAFAGGTWVGETGGRRGGTPIPPSLGGGGLHIVGALPMFGQVEAFALGFLGGAQTNGLVDGDQQDR